MSNWIYKLTELKLPVSVQRLASWPGWRAAWVQFGFDTYDSFVLGNVHCLLLITLISSQSMLPKQFHVLIEKWETSNALIGLIVDSYASDSFDWASRCQKGVDRWLGLIPLGGPVSIAHDEVHEVTFTIFLGALKPEEERHLCCLVLIPHILGWERIVYCATSVDAYYICESRWLQCSLITGEVPDDNCNACEEQRRKNSDYDSDKDFLSLVRCWLERSWLVKISLGIKHGVLSFLQFRILRQRSVVFKRWFICRLNVLHK